MHHRMGSHAASAGFPKCVFSGSAYACCDRCRDPCATIIKHSHFCSGGTYVTIKASAAGGLPSGTLEGTNDFRRAAYGGPCPPVGRHRYFHKLYALDTVMPDLKRPSKAALEKAMQGHVLAHAELIGTYHKR